MKSELRQDLVSGDWILISPGRGKRPDHFKEIKKRKRDTKKGCVFENPIEAGDGRLLASYPEGPSWKAQVVPNKYPAVEHEGVWVLQESHRGPFLVLPGYGYHEIVITKNHDNNFPKLTKKDAFVVFYAFRERYKALSKDSNVEYISIFHNWGEKAGASIYHPHYQILAIPVVAADVKRSIEGSVRYYKKHKSCVHCMQISWELEQKKRVILENKDAVAIAPYASKEPFEMRIFPKKHASFFEDTKEKQLESIADILRKSLKKLESALNYPDYNFFIHTAPVKSKNKLDFYHWHIEVIPRTNISAGFELGTDIEINQLDPNDAAEFLRKA